MPTRSGSSSWSTTATRQRWPRTTARRTTPRSTTSTARRWRATRVTTAHHQCGHAGPKERDDACADAAVWGTVTDADTGSSVEGAEQVVDGDTPRDAGLEPAATAKASTSGDSPAVPWGVDRTGARQAHDAGHTGAGTDVYVIDTGIQADHADLEPNLGTGHAVVDCLGLDCEKDWGDDDGHGTHVAGTIGATDAGQIVGMAPDVTLHAVKVLNALGAGSTSDVIAGIDWVAGQAEDDPGAVVANMSLGGSGERTGACTDTGFRGEDSYHEAICAATHEGVVFTVAAGNSDEDAQASVPAAYHDAVLTASATDETDKFAGFSNWGDDAFAWALELADQPTPQSAPVALAAPGVDVASTWNDGGTREASGTSMAAPHVGGGAALVASARGIGGDDRQAFLDVRAALMSEAEDTADFDDASSYDGQRQEGFLDMRFLAE
ncbi:MAG: hypothetical protein BRC31_00380 [Actinobacteria bacterium QS_5_72_10]|nr:MAG: hypothetical protein BRC31_00380 [Actinobacteria bacterium QS_5_72_10]